MRVRLTIVDFLFAGQAKMRVRLILGDSIILSSISH